MEQIRFTREDTKQVKAIAVLLMFMNHLFYSPDHGLTDIFFIPSRILIGGYPVEEYLGCFGDICVPLFAFMGGYGTYLSCRGKDPKGLVKTLYRKLAGLYKQYWTVLFVFVPLCILRGVPRVTTDIGSILGNFTGLEPRYTREWWFFAPYVIILCAYPLLQRLSGRFQSPASEILAVILCNAFLRYIVPMAVLYPWGESLKESFLYSKISEIGFVLPPFWMGCLCAKYDFLSPLKQKFSGNALYCVGAVLMFLCCPGIRIILGIEYDFLLAPVVVVCVVTAVNNRLCKSIRRILLDIGGQSTFIWLTHTVLCFHLCPRFVYGPKYPVLIFLLLLAMCMVTAKLLRRLMDAVDWGWGKLKALLTAGPLDN